MKVVDEISQSIDRQNINSVPEMTDEMSKYWTQPNRENILVGDEDALIDQASFDALHDYSATIPTGVYPGKMWKRNDGLFDPTCKPENRKWLLMWFGEENVISGKCYIHHRRIVICNWKRIVTS